jgi:UDP-N-acetylglucosamine 4,6-dehydratase
VIPIFREQAQTGILTITDPRMTRFWITLDEAVEFVLSCLPLATDGETFIPRIPSARIVDLAEAIAPDAERVYTGIRPGEKLHECLLTEDEARDTRDLGDRLAIRPHRNVRYEHELPDGFRYASDTNDAWLSVEDLRDLLGIPSEAAATL